MWDMVVVQRMNAVVAEGFEIFVKIIAYFVVPLVATQNESGFSNLDYTY